jgi:hypothetical protein
MQWSSMTRQVYVGSIALAASTVIPGELDERRASEEATFLEDKVCRPAGVSSEKRPQEGERYERNPEWRVVEAVRLVEEAVERRAQEHLTR